MSFAWGLNHWVSVSVFLREMVNLRKELVLSGGTDRFQVCWTPLLEIGGCGLSEKGTLGKASKTIHLRSQQNIHGCPLCFLSPDRRSECPARLGARGYLSPLMGSVSLEVTHSSKKQSRGGFGTHWKGF